MSIKKTIIDSFFGGWAESYLKGSTGTFNSSVAIDPDHSLSTSSGKSSGSLVPVVHEKFSSSLVDGNVKWMSTNPKNTNIYIYTDDPTSAAEFSTTSLFSDSGLVAYWKLEDLTDSKASYTLTNVNSVTFTSAKFTNGANLGTSNTDKYLSLNSDLGITGGAVSISLWVKITAALTTGTYVFFDTADSGTDIRNKIQYTYNSGNPIIVFSRQRENISFDNVNYSITLNTTDFYHLMYVYDGTTLKGYVNGLSVGTVASSGNGSFGVDIDYTYIGATRNDIPSVTNFANAIIDDVAVFNRVLTDTEVLTIFSSSGKLISYSKTFGSETLVSGVASGDGNGLAYYNNYLYIAKNTDIDRYGPLNGTAVYTANVWTGATLGTQTALTNTLYNFQSSYTFPNHSMTVHGDGSLYVCDYINGQGKIHRIKTTKTTVEGDTNNSSAYGVLSLPFGFFPTDIQSWGTDIVILATQTTDTVLNQGRAALFFWDGATTTFYKGPLYLPDPIATALEILNGQLYIFSGNSQGGVRVSKYIGGDSTQEVAFQEEGTPPPPGSTSVYGNRIYWGNHVTYPADILGVFSYGSKTEKLPQGLHCVAKATNTSTTTSAITALLQAEQSSGSRNKMIIAWRDSDGYGIDKYSTTATHNAVWRSEIIKVDSKFKIEKIRIPLGEAVTANMSLTVKVWLDDFSNSVTLTEINNTNYSGAKKVVYYGLELLEAIGQDNFCLEFTWAGTAQLPITIPIIIEYDMYEDENISS